MSKTKQILYLAVALALFLSLAACAVGTQEEENTLLEYPGVSWAATPEEVIQAMGFPEDRVQTGSDEETAYVGIEDWTCFGVPAQSIVFRFDTDSTGRNWLWNVEIIYPEDADMAAVRQAMTAEYGQPVDSYTTVWTQSVTDFDDPEARDFTVMQQTESLPENACRWLSPTGAEYYADEVGQALHERFNQVAQENYGRDWTDEEFSIYWENRPLVMVDCTETAFAEWDLTTSSANTPDYTSNIVSFNATALISANGYVAP